MFKPKSFAILYVLVNSFKHDKGVTHYHVEIRVETQCNID